MPPPSTSASPADVDNFALDDKAWLRLLVVIVSILAICGICAFIRCYRSSKRSRVRRYDLLSAKQLAPELVLNDSDSSDDSDSDRRQLVPPAPATQAADAS
ncbi:hypothetical protein L596_007651 [Steinernema carpocapsae]|uniref:Uncharacterized protein n=1 Tax=Steinernema carpocapsae TaxID=34508 RepID=A0A4U5PA22_STECR|nr:hypothetical protein L596_007651 [Steinernema carpocapsae]